jgi:drug/metabolite transporter (DMT)-like permease
MKGQWRTHLYLLLSNLIYGASFTIAKAIIPEYIKPYGMILIRVTVTAAMFLIIQWLFVKEKIARRDVPLLIICALFGVTINQLLFFKGLSMTSPISASIISTTTPILVFVFAFFLHEEKLGLKKIAGIIAGAAGAVIIITAGKEINLSAGSFLGDVLVFANAASYAVYLVIIKPLMKKYQPLTIITWVFFFGWLFVVPVGWNEFSHINWQAITPMVWWAIIFVVIFTTFFSYLLNILALKTTTSSVVGIYIYVQPIFATLIAVLFGKDQLNLQNILASLLIFIGVYLVSFSKQPLTATNK